PRTRTPEHLNLGHPNTPTPERLNARPGTREAGGARLNTQTPERQNTRTPEHLPSGYVYPTARERRAAAAAAARQAGAPQGAGPVPGRRAPAVGTSPPSAAAPTRERSHPSG